MCSTLLVFEVSLRKSVDDDLHRLFTLNGLQLDSALLSCAVHKPMAVAEHPTSYVKRKGREQVMVVTSQERWTCANSTCA